MGVRRRVLLLVLVAGTACSTGGNRGESRPPPSTAALETAFRSYQAAYLDGDGVRAWELVSERCQRKVSKSRVIQQARRYSTFFDGLDTTITEVEIRRIPDDALSATITSYAIGGTVVPYPDPWIVEDGEWHHDLC